ncbi:hypothetical protein DPMN_194448 [Dreissena polymorpha]|uniref:Uncharacterized protein n=1 Tax=Dreissena polymorpha TaxID=45954 RepID=A0A9D3XYN0_DREPO|nr:hypothetical protein DPMN_194448 [Dreissena polymorpha]
MWRLSATASGESVAEGTLTGPYGPVTHNRSLKFADYLSEYVTQSDESWQTCLARWATHAKSAMWRPQCTASGESVAEGTLNWPVLAAVNP